jgi:hypothetical protein
MRIRMTVAQFWQHAGTERPLSIGEVYDVPMAVAQWLIHCGFATGVGATPIETKPSAPAETKRGRR